MRGDDEQTGGLFSYVSCEARVPLEHPLRLIRVVVDEALDALSAEFDRLHARVGRHPGYTASQRVRKRIEEVFGWIKSSAGLR